MDAREFLQSLATRPRRRRSELWDFEADIRALVAAGHSAEVVRQFLVANGVRRSAVWVRQFIQRLPVKAVVPVLKKTTYETTPTVQDSAADAAGMDDLQRLAAHWRENREK
ncbi:hypothetical protein [Laribacter hongkongensis]|uniref:hypothetical protein n=1 Tax=Laribacter hongkongensis TaxID=168471 RepID=UPI001EFCDB04|nr:hypothetical protein [Laribacter hongkongensis]MCG9100441.1 hypothetical protein [Laribacter hongkongensis]